MLNDIKIKYFYINPKWSKYNKSLLNCKNKLIILLIISQ